MSRLFRNRVPPFDFSRPDSNSQPSGSASGPGAAASNWDFSRPPPSSAQSSATVNHRPSSPAPFNPADDPFYFDDDPFEPPLFVPEDSPEPLPPFASVAPSPQQSPPPSNQQARHNAFGIADLLNSDPFDNFYNANPTARASPPQSNAIDLTEGVVDLTSSPDMAPARKRKRATESEKAPKKSRPSSASKVEQSEVVDLAEVNNEEEYEALKMKQKAEEIKKQQQEEATRPIKLAEFQCIICMDNPTDLTVTHCGHLFCSQCLHEAIYAGNSDKKSCPVCRTTIGITLQGRDKKQPRNGVFHLEMKLMTSNRKGKMPQRSN